MRLPGRRYALALIASALIHAAGAVVFLRRPLVDDAVAEDVGHARLPPWPGRPVAVTVGVRDRVPTPARGSPQAAQTPLLVSAVAGESEREVAHPTAPTRAPNPDRFVARAAASSDDGAGVRQLSLTGRRDRDEMRVQAFDGVSAYRLQRIRTSETRESREDVRATPHPGLTPHLASRAGEGHGRSRPGASRLGDPGSEGRVSASARAGVDIRGEPRDRAGSRSDEERARGDARIGKDGEAAEGFARPMIAAGPAATDGGRRAESVADRSDSPIASNELRPGHLELSHPGFLGSSDRGRGDGGAPAWASRGSGTEAVPAGDPSAAPGETLEVATYRRHRSRYLAEVVRRVDPLWEFPRDLSIRLEQGDVVVNYTIRRDGSLKNVKVVKGSGFRSFDAAVVAALHKAAPYPPLDPLFGEELRLTSLFDGRNPLVQ